MRCDYIYGQAERLAREEAETMIRRMEQLRYLEA